MCSFLPAALGADRSMVWRTILNGTKAPLFKISLSYFQEKKKNQNLFVGGRIGYSDGGAELFDDTRQLRPTAFFAPPAIWSSLYAECKQQISACTSLEMERGYKVLFPFVSLPTSYLFFPLSFVSLSLSLSLSCPFSLSHSLFLFLFPFLSSLSFSLHLFLSLTLSQMNISCS